MIRNPRLLASAAALVLLLSSFAASAASAEPAQQKPRPTNPSAGAVVPPLKFRERTLKNGLKVISSQDRATPTVAIYVWYHVGSKDDPPNRSGFAHLFEHLMFKSTKNMKSEMLDRLTEDVGGENNAYTDADVTVYHETVPSNYLETLLWAEAERMVNLNVDQANFASERDVVKEEFRQSVLAPPYGRLGWLTENLSYVKHPYRRPTIGSIEDLSAASLEDVRKFYRTFYRPDNATLVVVGDFDPQQLDAWVDKYFGRIPKPAAKMPRVTVKEPPRKAEKRYNETSPNVPLPAVVATYLTPGIASRDADALQVLDVILSGGESSRLYRSLVYEQQVAAEAYSYANLNRDAGLLVVGVIAAGGKALADGEKAAFAEIEKLRSRPVTTAELAKAKNRVITDVLRSRETNDGRAQALGAASVLLGDTNRVNTDVARLQAVTAADVQRVARTYLSPTNRVVIRYTAAPQTPSASKKGGAAR